MTVPANILGLFGESGVRFETDIPLSELTSYSIGGPADLVVYPGDAGEIAFVLSRLYETGIPVFPLGRGTNILASDDGYRGALVRPFSEHCRSKNHGEFNSGAGLKLDRFVEIVSNEGWIGVEDLAGIPGSIGGAIAMNAGAWGVYISEFLSGVMAFDITGGEVDIDLSDTFGYRTFSGRGRVFVAEADFTFADKTSPNILRERIDENIERRRSTQPMDERSAGCVFKNPAGDHAGRLVEEAGLKGTSIGGAVVSEIHANFIVNRGGAKAEDVRALIDIVRERVAREFGVDLKLEIIELGFEY